MFTEVNYSSITIDLDDYFKHTWVFFRNKTELDGSKISTFSHKASFNGVSEWDEFYKCIELNWNTARPDLIKEIFVVYHTSAILQDLTPRSECSIDLYIHYPGQFY